MRVYLRNLMGWSTKRKLLVFESDDWGSIRMPSLETYYELKKLGIELDKGSSYRYNQFDKLESSDDLCKLFDILVKYKDMKGRNPVITAMLCTGNPDFGKIIDSSFEKYFCEPFTETLKKYYYNDDVLTTLKQGVATGVFHPQFHGREHLNIITWMKALRDNDPKTLAAFKFGFWGFKHEKYRPDYQAAFDFIDKKEIEEHKHVLSHGIKIFKDIFNFHPDHFAPPNGYISEELFSFLTENGIKSIVTSRQNLVPLGNGKYKKKYRVPGKTDKSGIRYLMRNCFFEPNYSNIDWVATCLKEIEIAFYLRKPAIIGNHRTSFMGGLNIQNRQNGLTNLNLLLKSITNKWPEVEFVSSSELVKIMEQNHG